MKIWLTLHSDAPRVVLKSAASLAGVPVSSGKRLEGLISTDIKVGVDRRDPLLDCFHAGPLLVLHRRLAAVLERFRGDLELFNVEVAHGARRISGDYFFANILSECDCVSWVDSEYKERWGARGSFTKLVLNPGQEIPYDYFRLALTSPALVCVSSALAEEIGGDQFSGVRLIEIEDFRSPESI